jgi:hypothetical protein
VVWKCRYRQVRTRWAVRVVFGEGEFRLEVAAVVEGVRVQHDKGGAPLKDVLVDELQRSVGCSLCRCPVCEPGERLTSMLVHVSLLSALNSFMSNRSADCAILPSLRSRVWEE